MHLAILLMAPLALAMPRLYPHRTNELNIEADKLLSVELTEPVDHLDLSNLRLRGLERNAFERVSRIKSLTLENNLLQSIPQFVFSNLSDLVELSLARNQLDNVENLFVGLEKLKKLNISYNPIVHLRRGHLFGLTKSVNIYTEGNVLWSISTDAFTNAFLKDETDSTVQLAIAQKETISKEAQQQQKEKEMMEKDVQVEVGRSGSSRVPKSTTTEAPMKELRIQVCMTDDIVRMLDARKRHEALQAGCEEVPFDERKKKLSLRGLGIKAFEEGWYQLRSLEVAAIDFSNNDITEITKELLNDLPASVVYVNLAENSIRNIWKQVIENEYLRSLNLKGNAIETIEEEAFGKTRLTGLFLTENHLENLNFVKSLPESMTEFVLSGNQIVDIPVASFSRLKNLLYLNVANNKMAKLRNGAFHGLNDLQVLILTRNAITEIETMAFEGLKSLTTLYLYRNFISRLDRNTFAPLDKLQELNIAWNKLSDLSNGTLAELPKTLESLHLDSNEIKRLDEGTFVQVPKFTLSLNDNNISSIAKGAFDLPNLRDLHLNNNTLNSIEGDSYKGLPRLQHLWLSGNKIAEIRKGSCKNLGSLNVLDISGNPFEELQNGAFYGLSPERGSFVYIYDNRLKSIQGGIFEDS